MSLKELGMVATNKQLTYEQATFYSTLYSLLLNCMGKGAESTNINNAKKIIDLLVAHGLEQEIASSYHKLKAQTPDEEMPTRPRASGLSEIESPQVVFNAGSTSAIRKRAYWSVMESYLSMPRKEEHHSPTTTIRLSQSSLIIQSPHQFEF